MDGDQSLDPFDPSAFATLAWAPGNLQRPARDAERKRDGGASLSIVARGFVAWWAAVVELAELAGCNSAVNRAEAAKRIAIAVKEGALGLFVVTLGRDDIFPSKYPLPSVRAEPGRRELRGLHERAGEIHAATSPGCIGADWLHVDENGLFLLRIALEDEATAREVEAIRGSTAPRPNTVQPSEGGQPRRRGGRDYRDQDLDLVKEMRRRLSVGEADSSWDAALSLADKADGKGDPESRAKRLLKRFQESAQD